MQFSMLCFQILNCFFFYQHLVNDFFLLLEIDLNFNSFIRNIIASLTFVGKFEKARSHNQARWLGIMNYWLLRPVKVLIMLIQNLCKWQTIHFMHVNQIEFDWSCCRLSCFFQHIQNIYTVCFQFHFVCLSISVKYT